MHPRTSRVACAFLFAATGLASLAAQQSAPARDGDVTPTYGTASLSGVIVNDEGKPVRRAIVTLAGEGLRPSRGAISDDEGHFSFARLPAGRFTITVSRASYVTSMYGAKRPGRVGTPVAVAADAAVKDVVVKLWRGAVIAGVVRDEQGTPVPGLPVTATPLRTGRATLLTLTNNGARTNDAGEYRIFGLEPGRYVVSVRPSSGGGGPQTALTDAQVDATFAAIKQQSPTASRTGSGPIDTQSSRPFEYAPVFHPSAIAPVQAQPIPVAAGQEALGVDISLQRVPTATIRGRLVRVDGRPASGASLQLRMTVPPGPFAGDAPVINANADSQGSFQITQVLPGEYRLIARAPIDPPPAADERLGIFRPEPVMASLWAVRELNVSGADIDNLALTLEPGVTITGRVVFDGQTLEPPKDLSQIRVFMAPPAMLTLRPGQGLSSSQFIMMPSHVPVRADGSFEIPNILADTYKLMVSGAGIGPTGWQVRTATAANTDWLNGLVTLFHRQNISDLVVTLSDRHSALSGNLETSDGQPVSDVFVLAFSTTRAHWGLGSGRVHAVRPSIDGAYRIADLPAGEYFICALTDVDQDEWLDPGFLDKLIASSIKITIAEGEQKVQSLRVGGDDRRARRVVQASKTPHLGAY